MGLAALLVGAPACKSHSKKKKDEDTSSRERSYRTATRRSPRIPSNEPVFLNPVIQNQHDQANPLIFEGLVGLDSRLEPVPRLATEWDLSNGGKTLTFKLRKNVKWHDGEPFTAKDVAYTFQAIRATKERSLWKAYMAAVSSLDTPDDHTVVVNYEKPFAPALTTWTVGIIPRHVYGDGDVSASPANKEPVGTGPVQTAALGRGQAADSCKPTTRGGTDGRYINSIELLVEITQDKVVAALKKGDIDFAPVEDITEWRDQLQTSEIREEFEVHDVVESDLSGAGLERQAADPGRQASAPGAHPRAQPRPGHQ